MGLSALTVVLIAVPIILFLMIFTSSSGNFVQDYLIDVIAAYPADETTYTCKSALAVTDRISERTA